MKRKRREKLLISAIGLFLTFVVIPGTSYAIPNTINYQGYLTDDAGSAVDGTVNITFSIYDTDIGPTAQWTEVHDGGGSNPPAVSVSNGIFSVILGETNPIVASCLDSGNCYLGVSVGGDSEMSPRQKLTSVAYSIRADLAESVVNDGVGSAQIVNNSIISEDIADFYVGDSSTGGSNTFIGSTAGLSNSGRENTFVGEEAGRYNTSAERNTFLGSNAGGSNNIGSYNTFLGYAAGFHNTTGQFNTFVGHDVGIYNNANNNTFLGSGAGYFNTTGTQNTFIGSTSGYENTEGNDNTFIGMNAGQANITANNNTFLGSHAGSNNTVGESNTFVGLAAGAVNTTANENTFIGKDAGRNNIDGNNNTFLGSHAGYSNTEGTDNIFIGESSGWNNTTGNNNTFIGQLAGDNNTTARNNTFIGRHAGRDNTSGGDNTFIGMGAGIGNGTGNLNTFIGRYAGNSNYSGTNNVFLGNEAGYHEGGSNKLYIDSSNTSSPLIYGDFSSNRVSINGNTPTRTLYVNGDAGGNSIWYNDSDRNLKKNIRAIEGALEKVENLRGVYYEWKDTDTRSEGQQLGMIAQEVKEVVPEVVQRKGEYYSMATASLVPLLIEAVKDQQKIIVELEKSKKAEIESLRNQIAHLRTMVETVMAQQTESKDSRDLVSMSR